MKVRTIKLKEPYFYPPNVVVWASKKPFNYTTIVIIIKINNSRLAVFNADLRRNRAVGIDSRYHVCSGSRCTLLDLVNERRHLFGGYCAKLLNSYTVTLARFLGDDVLYPMITLVKEHCREIRYDENKTTRVRLCLSSLLYISGQFSTKPAYITKNDALFLPKASLCAKWRTGAKVDFSFSENVRMDAVMVQGDEEDRSFFKKRLIFIWFAKAWEVLRFNLDLVNSRTSRKRTGEKVKETGSVY